MHVSAAAAAALPDVAGGKPSIEVPSGEDFFNQHEHDNPEGFFDSLPDHPTPPPDYTPSGMSAGGLDSQRRTSSMGGPSANGIMGEPSTPLAIDPNHIPEGAERVGGGGCMCRPHWFGLPPARAMLGFNEQLWAVDVKCKGLCACCL